MKLLRPSPKWYTAGLAFECSGCGRCCAGPEEGYVWVNQSEVQAIAQFLGISTEQMRSQYVRNVGRRMSLREGPSRDCIFLLPEPQPGTGRGCKVYPVRPRQCRTWPFWPGNIRNPDSWSEAADRCPGINRGPLHPAENIEAKARETRE